MKKTALIAARCTDVLRQEIALLGRIAGTQEIVRNAAFARDWKDMDSLFARLGDYGREFEILERERLRVFSELGGGGTERVPFYALTARLDEPTRRELSDLYRRLKLDLLKVRLANESLGSYLQEARSTISEFMAAAFPDRKGNLYSKRGIRVESEMRSLVLDRSL